MTSQQINYFLSAVRHLSFTKVAEEFYTSQPTVSRQIAQLEEELGFELFKRDKGNLCLTSGGAVLAQELPKASDIINNAMVKVKRISEGLEGEISIGCVGGMNTDAFVYPHTIKFTKRYPSINVMMETGSFSSLRKSLNTNEFDIIFTLDFELRTMQDVLPLKCYVTTGIIAMAASHPLAAKEDLSTQDFSGQTFLIPRQSDSEVARTKIINTLADLNIKDVKLQDMNGNESILFGVRSGSGVALLDTSMEIIFDNRYKCFHLPAENSISVVAVQKKNNYNPIVPIYLDMLKESLEMNKTEILKF